MIREATEADVPALLALAKAQVAEDPAYASIPLNAEKASAMIVKLVNRPSATVLVWEAPTREVGGFFFGILESTWWADETLAIELIWGVAPRYRGTMAAYRLVKAFCNWADSRGADKVVIGADNVAGAQSAKRLLERLGFKQRTGPYERG
jgi:GNAT superfamily N-acetyltransferase